MEDTRAVLTASELTAFVQKLEAWAVSLPPKERAFLEQMVSDAADAANEDASGYVNLASVVPSDEVSGYDLGLSGPLGSAVTTYAIGIMEGEDPLDDRSFILENS
jgi:hypothetical protein